MIATAILYACFIASIALLANELVRYVRMGREA